MQSCPDQAVGGLAARTPAHIRISPVVGSVHHYSTLVLYKYHSLADLSPKSILCFCLKILDLTSCLALHTPRVPAVVLLAMLILCFVLTKNANHPIKTGATL